MEIEWIFFLKSSRILWRRGIAREFIGLMTIDNKGSQMYEKKIYNEYVDNPLTRYGYN